MGSRVFSWKRILACLAIVSLVSGAVLITEPPAFAGKQGGGGKKKGGGGGGGGGSGGGGKQRQGGGGGCPPGLVKKGGACVPRGGGGQHAGPKGGKQQQGKKQDSGPKGAKKRDDDGRNRAQGGKHDDDKKQSGRGPDNSPGNIQGGGTAQGGKHDDDDKRQGGKRDDDDKQGGKHADDDKHQGGRDNKGGYDCKPPLVYSNKHERCVNPEPEHANCIEPYYYSEKHHGCVKRDDIRPVDCRWPLVPVGDLCACPLGTVYRNGTCERPPVIIVDPPRGGPPSYVPPDDGPPPGPPPGGGAPPPREASPPPEPDTPAVAPVADRCLPQDLYDLLVDTYGQRPGLSVCPTPCLPKPLSYSDTELDRLSKIGGFEWCTNCLEVGAYMPLSSILEIEKRTNLTICVDPSVCRLLPAFVDRRTEIRTIYEGLPEGTKNEGNIAVIVGNRDYQGDIPDNPNAHSDADSVKTLLIDQLGYAQENIIDLRDGTLSDFERVFGSDSDPGGEIAKRIDKQDPEDVFVYVASHGMVKEDDLKEVYLLPVDATKDDLDKSAYGLQQLYDNLGKTGARTTMLLLEANFAKTLDELINPPNLPELEIEAMPVNPVPGLVVLKASDRDQRAIQDPEYGIGLFTRYAIEGFAGKADQAPIGNEDKRIDTVELYVYTADMVRQAARKSFGLEQKPMLSKIDNLVVGQLASN